MNTYDNIRHDLSDASFSVTTAIELLNGIEDDGGADTPALAELITKLERVRDELEGLRLQVTAVEGQITA